MKRKRIRRRLNKAGEKEWSAIRGGEGTTKIGLQKEVTGPNITWTVPPVHQPSYNTKPGIEGFMP